MTEESIKVNADLSLIKSQLRKDEKFSLYICIFALNN